MKPILIGIGGKMRHGKDTTADIIIKNFGRKYDIRKYSLAAPLKAGLYDLLLNQHDPYWGVRNFLKVPHPRTNETYFNEEDKIAWVNAHKEELREDLQFYGTEWCRKGNPFYWVRKLDERIAKDQPQIAVIPDIRQSNEYAYVGGNGGFLIKVIRQGYIYDPGTMNHVSETALDGRQWHFEITVGDGDLQELERDVIWVFERIEEKLGGEAYASEKDFQDAVA